MVSASRVCSVELSGSETEDQYSYQKPFLVTLHLLLDYMTLISAYERFPCIH